MTSNNENLNIESTIEALSTTTAHLFAAISLLENGGRKAASSNKIFLVMLDDYRKAAEVGRKALIKAKGLSFHGHQGHTK